jgi:hypothetical protein
MEEHVKFCTRCTTHIDPLAISPSLVHELHQQHIFKTADVHMAGGFDINKIDVWFVGQMNGSYPVQLLTKTLMADEVAAGIVEMLRHSGMRLMRVRAATAWLVRLGLSTDQANVNEAVAKMRTLFQTAAGPVTPCPPNFFLCNSFPTSAPI